MIFREEAEGGGVMVMTDKDWVQPGAKQISTYADKKVG